MTTLDKLKDDFNKIGHRNATLNNLTLIADLTDKVTHLLERIDELEAICEKCNTPAPKRKAKRSES